MSSQRVPLQREPLEAPAPPVSTPHAAVSSPQTFSDIAPDAVIESMNRRINRRNFALPAGIVIAGGLLAASVPWPVVAAIGLLATVLVAVQHSRSKYSTMVYGDEEETAQRLVTLHKSVAALRSADSLWSVREATHGNGLTAHPPTLSRARIAREGAPLPKYLRTNIAPASLQLSDGTLFFFRSSKSFQRRPIELTVLVNGNALFFQGL